MSARHLSEPLDAVKMLFEVSEHGVGVTAWERTFIAQIAELLERGGELSSAQQRKLEEIYQERRHA